MISKLYKFFTLIIFLTPFLFAQGTYQYSLNYDPNTEWGNWSSNGPPPEYRGVFYAKIEIGEEVFKNLKNPAIFLGRIADADETFLNGNLIGSTGVINGRSYLFTHLNRLYPIKEYKKHNELLIKVHKVALSPIGIGPQSSPQFDEFEKLHKKAVLLDIIRSHAPKIIGFIILAFGLFFVFISYYLSSRKDYFYFGLTCCLFSIFSLCYSFWLYELLLPHDLVFQLHSMSAYWALSFACMWFLEDQKLYNYVKKVVVGAAIIFSVWTLATPNIDQIFEIFLKWHVILYLGIFIFIWQSVNGFLSYRKQEHVWSFVGMTIFSLVMLYDSLQTINIIRGESILVPTYGLVLLSTCFLLVRDFTLAYLNVEIAVKDRTAELSMALERLRELDQMKDRFFTNISHDLKTPITIAIANISEAAHLVEDKGKAFLTTANTALNRLQNMVLNILDVAKAESGQLSVNLKSEPISQIIKEWANDYSTLLRNRGIYIHVKSNVADNLYLPVDRAKMERVFDNVISNAIKFAGRGGDIFVRLNSSDSQFILELEDSGPGVPEDERHQIFQRYFQGSSIDLKDHGGSGIGLFFVKDVIEQMNGIVSVKDGDRFHSKFVIALPLSQEIDLAEDHTRHDKENSAKPLNRTSVEVPYPPSDPKDLDSDKPNLLILEDNAEIAQILLHVLEAEYNVFFAENGEKGLEKLKSETYACVISDIMMPKMNGTEFIKQMRSEKAYHMTPILILTSKGEVEDVVKHLQMGAQDYLVKPFNNDILKARIQTQVNTYKLKDKLLVSEKMAALGILAAGIAHEIKNPLMVSMNSAKLIASLAERLKELDQNKGKKAAHDYFLRKFEHILFSGENLPKHLERINQIVKGMGGYSSMSMDRIDIEVNDMIAQCSALLSGKCKEKGVKIVVEGDARIVGYPSLHQVFVNLFDNAIYAVPPGGKIDVSIVEKGNCVTIRVEDNGEGIPKETLRFIFDPFHSSKPAGVGTGLGLFISHDIVENLHHGSMSVSSQKDRGTVFIIKLPKEAPTFEKTNTTFHGMRLEYGNT